MKQTHHIIKADTRRADLLAVGRAHKTIFRPTPGTKDEFLKALISQCIIFCVRDTQRWKKREKTDLSAHPKRRLQAYLDRKVTQTGQDQRTMVLTVI